MSQFPVHTLETAPQSSRETLKAVEKKYRFVPNLFGVLANAPAAVRAYAAIGDALAHAQLGPVEQQVVMIAVSAENGCHYCVAAHSTVATMQRMPQQVLEALRKEDEIPDKKLEALRSFTVKAVRQRGWLSDEELQEFYSAGFAPVHVLEVFTVIALKTLSNYTNHVVQTPLDEAFGSQRWEKASPKD